VAGGGIAHTAPFVYDTLMICGPRRRLLAVRLYGERFEPITDSSGCSRQALRGKSNASRTRTCVDTPAIQRGTEDDDPEPGHRSHDAPHAGT
jgi:hypothetical protein